MSLFLQPIQLNFVVEYEVMDELIKNSWEKGITYEEYKNKVENWVNEGKTSGPVQSEDLAGHTKMGWQRLKKWEKISRLNENTLAGLKELERSQKWLMIVEAWCGDVGQNLATINQMAEEAGIELRLVFRDENLELMDRFLTNGGRSIPKLIMLDAETLEVLNDWGPRPTTLQEWFWAEKEKPEFDKGQLMHQIHLWYAKDKQSALQEELLGIINDSQGVAKPVQNS